MDWKKYLKFFFIGGLATFFGELIIDKYKNGIALSSYLYGCVPTIYLLLLWFSYIKNGKKGYDTFIVHSLLNCGIFYFILIVLFLLSFFIAKKNIKFNIFFDFFIATLIFILYSIFYFIFIFKKNFLF